jgi:hypothetical protein
MIMLRVAGSKRWSRGGKNKATVALANKLMRIAWIVLTQEVEYDMRKAFRPQST